MKIPKFGCTCPWPSVLAAFVLFAWLKTDNMSKFYLENDGLCTVMHQLSPRYGTIETKLARHIKQIAYLVELKILNLSINFWLIILPNVIFNVLSSRFQYWNFQIDDQLY